MNKTRLILFINFPYLILSLFFSLLSLIVSVSIVISLPHNAAFPLFRFGNSQLINFSFEVLAEISVFCFVFSPIFVHTYVVNAWNGAYWIQPTYLTRIYITFCFIPFFFSNAFAMSEAKEHVRFLQYLCIVHMLASAELLEWYWWRY